MRYLYITLLYLATPWMLARLLLRAHKNRAYAARLKERFGFIPLINNKKSIWLHAVSLGELIAATPLIKGLLQQYPQHTLVVTTTTPTGSQAVQKQFGTTVYHVYTPFDLPGVIRRFIARTRPEKVIIMETELWPNLLHELTCACIPVMLANARLSSRSFERYKRLRFFFQPFLAKITLIAAQSKADAERFKKLGAQQVLVTGNIKFDIDIPNTLLEAAKILKSHWQSRPCWIAASTHEGEEPIILEALQRILKKFPNALLILVPRHPERFDKVATLCQEAGFHLARRSRQEHPKGNQQIYLGDTVGELKRLYAASDCAFVGGSFMPVGGHNLIEPASLSLPVLSGPHLENFTAVRDLLHDAGGLILTTDAADLSEKITQLFSDEQTSHLYGARALSVVDQNRGAISRHLHLFAENV